MIKNISQSIQYLTFICFFWIGISTSIQAQTVSVTPSVDSNCLLTIDLRDSFNNTISTNPPYLFSIGGIHQNSALGLASIDVANLVNGTYPIQVLDGNQTTYSSTITINCGQTAPSNGFLLNDTLLSQPTNCDSCDGSMRVNVVSPLSPPYVFSWSDGVTSTNNGSHLRNNLCPGIYTVVVSDSSGTLNSAINVNVPCTGTTPQTTSCTQSLDLFLDNNGNATLFPQTLNTAPIDPTRTQAYIVDQFNTISSTYQFDCQDLGYHYLTLLFIDSLQQTADTCSVRVHLQDSSNNCNGLMANTNGFNGTSINASSCNTCDGSYTFIYFVDSLTSGAATNFLWNDGATTSVRNDLCPNFNYTLTVTDSYGNLYMDNIYINCAGSNCIDSNSIDSNLLCPTVYAPVCGCDNVSYINACIAAYEYGITSWTQGPCGVNSLSLNISTTPHTVCDTVAGCNGTANIAFSGGTPPYNTFWSDTTIIGNNPTNLCAGIYLVTVVDAANDSVVSIVNIGTDGCVWPGDSDDNTVVNNFDLLPIGLSYGDTGLSRASTSTSWAPYASTDWNLPGFAGLPDAKHADCNGDGVIDSTDVWAISSNYGQSFFRSSSNSLMGPAPFYVQNTSGLPGDTLFAPIILGDVANLITNGYAVAFTINYNPDYIKPGSISATFLNSWLGNDLISIQKDFNTVGQLEVAISRKTKMPITGYGPVGMLGFTIKDDVFIGMISRQDTIITPFTISAVRLIDHYNIEIGTTPLTGIASISELTSITKIHNNLDLQLYPNPVDKLLNINSKNAEMLTINLYSATGQLIETITNPNAYQHRISTEKLAVGVYFLSIQTNKGIYNDKIKIIR